jgi:hypothetical protein
MPLTRNFRDTVRAPAEREPAFRRALFQEAALALLRGELDEGRTALLVYVYIAEAVRSVAGCPPFGR